MAKAKSKRPTSRRRAGGMLDICAILRRTADSLDGPDNLGAAREVDRLVAALSKEERVLVRAVARGIERRIAVGG